MKLPKEIVTPTKFAKIFALIVLVALPFVGFWLGRLYRDAIIFQPESEIVVPVAPTL